MARTERKGADRSLAAVEGEPSANRRMRMMMIRRISIEYLLSSPSCRCQPSGTRMETLLDSDRPRKFAVRPASLTGGPLPGLFNAGPVANGHLPAGRWPSAASWNHSSRDRLLRLRRANAKLPEVREILLRLRDQRDEIVAVRDRIVELNAPLLAGGASGAGASGAGASGAAGEIALRGGRRDPAAADEDAGPRRPMQAGQSSSTAGAFSCARSRPGWWTSRRWLPAGRLAVLALGESGLRGGTRPRRFEARRRIEDLV